MEELHSGRLAEELHRRNPVEALHSRSPAEERHTRSLTEELPCRRGSEEDPAERDWGEAARLVAMNLEDLRGAQGPQWSSGPALESWWPYGEVVEPRRS